MRYLLENRYKVLSIFFGAFWVTTFIVGLFIGSTKISLFSAKVEFVIHGVTLAYLTYLYFKTKKSIISSMFVICVVLLLVDVLYYFGTYVPSTGSIGNILSFICNTLPCIVYSIIMIFFLRILLLKYVFNSTVFAKLVKYLIFYNFILISIFIINLHYLVKNFDFNIYSQLTLLSFELIMFDFVVIGLITVKSKSALQFLLGTASLIASDFFLTYSANFNLSTGIYQYGELFWQLGLILILLSFVDMDVKNDFNVQDWFENHNTISVNTTFTTFGLSISGFIIFFVMGYLFNLFDNKIFAYIPIFILYFSVIYIIISKKAGNLYSEPFEKLSSIINKLKMDNISSEHDSFYIREFDELQNTIVSSFKYRKELEDIKSKFGQLVAEVAHDLKSPVTALNLTLKKIQENKIINDNSLRDLHLATKNITDISSGILINYYQLTDDEEINKNNYIDDGNQNRYIILPELIESIISQKHIEYNEKLDISLKCDEWFYSNLCQISPIKLSRSISNLINNSIQSCKNRYCNIQISLSNKESYLKISISDNGCGIPSDKVTEILSSGKSSKHRGNGIGINNCKKYLEEVQGRLLINSKENMGTEVILELPLVYNPKWFTNKVNFIKDQTFIVIDDDSRIISQWQLIFSKIGVPALYFLDLKSFEEWLQNNKNSSYIIFSDYDLKDNINGYEFFRGLKDKLYNSEIIILTDHAEDEWLQCKFKDENKIKLIPKSMIERITIKRE